MTKYYRVKEDNFMWKQGAIISDFNVGKYKPVEDIWDNTPCNAAEYISARIIEHGNNSAYFERVYRDSISGSLFKTADQMKQAYKDSFKK